MCLMVYVYALSLSLSLSLSLLLSLLPESRDGERVRRWYKLDSHRGHLWDRTSQATANGVVRPQGLTRPASRPLLNTDEDPPVCNDHVPLSAATIERPPPVLRSWTLRTYRVSVRVCAYAFSRRGLFDLPQPSPSVWFTPTSMWWGPAPPGGEGKHVRVCGLPCAPPAARGLAVPHFLSSALSLGRVRR